MKKGNQTPATEIDAQCGAHGCKMPHASSTTAHYMVRHFDHPVALLTHSNHPCYYPAVDPTTV